MALQHLNIVFPGFIPRHLCIFSPLQGCQLPGKTTSTSACSIALGEARPGNRTSWILQKWCMINYLTLNVNHCELKIYICRLMHYKYLIAQLDIISLYCQLWVNVVERDTSLILVRAHESWNKASASIARLHWHCRTAIWNIIIFHMCVINTEVKTFI